VLGIHKLTPLNTTFSEIIDYCEWSCSIAYRENNYGARLDYILADKNLSKYLIDADIHPNFPGSDHCPVSATFNLKMVPSSSLPKTASKFYPEFKLKQSTLVELLQGSEKVRKQDCRTFQSFSGQATPSAIDTSVSTTNSKKRKLESQPGKQRKLSDFFSKKNKCNSEEPQDSCCTPPFESSECQTKQDLSRTEMLEEPVEIKSATSKPKTEFFVWPKPPKIPLCKHNVPSVLRTVKKKGPNQGRTFYSCSRGKGAKDDPNGDCGFFSWR
jgi:AP endonuclease-2